jgi:hypothetical protein
MFTIAHIRPKSRRTHLSIVIPNRAKGPVRNLLSILFCLRVPQTPSEKDREGHEFHSCRKSRKKRTGRQPLRSSAFFSGCSELRSAHLSDVYHRTTQSAAWRIDVAERTIDEGLADVLSGPDHAPPRLILAGAAPLSVFFIQIVSLEDTCLKD